LIACAASLRLGARGVHKAHAWYSQHAQHVRHALTYKLFPSSTDWHENRLDDCWGTIIPQPPTHTEWTNAGCLLAEMLSGAPLFPGETDVDQLWLIHKCLGGPCAVHAELMLSNPLLRSMRLPCAQELAPLEARFPAFHPDALQLLTVGCRQVFSPFSPFVSCLPGLPPRCSATSHGGCPKPSEPSMYPLTFL
jgi:hypothetical protein